MDKIQKNPSLSLKSSFFMIILVGEFTPSGQTCTQNTAVGRKLYQRGHDKEKFVERHYFLRLQKQFPEKWGDESVGFNLIINCSTLLSFSPPVPTALQNL